MSVHPAVAHESGDTSEGKGTGLRAAHPFAHAGVVALWDVGTGQQIADYEAHDKRIWTVDFCHSDPMHFISGSDDGWVKVPGPTLLWRMTCLLRCYITASVSHCIGTNAVRSTGPSTCCRIAHRCCCRPRVLQIWSTKEQDSLAAIDMKANVCCVKYNPSTPHQVPSSWSPVPQGCLV